MHFAKQIYVRSGHHFTFIAVFIDSDVMMSSDLYGTCSYFFLRDFTQLNIVPIKYSSDIHTPKHNYDIINIADITV